jgi:hypothetical protein
MWCKNPSPGLLTYSNDQWQKVPGATPNSAIPPESAAGKSISCQTVPANFQKRAYGRRSSRDAHDDWMAVMAQDSGDWETSKVSSRESHLEIDMKMPVKLSNSNQNITAPDINPAAAEVLVKRQDSSSVLGGSYLDINIYDYLPFCQSDDDYDPCYLSQCNYYDTDGDMVGDVGGGSATTSSTTSPTSTTTSTASTPTVTCTDS